MSNNQFQTVLIAFASAIVATVLTSYLRHISRLKSARIKQEKLETQVAYIVYVNIHEAALTSHLFKRFFLLTNGSEVANEIINTHYKENSPANFIDSSLESIHSLKELADTIINIFDNEIQLRMAVDKLEYLPMDAIPLLVNLFRYKNELRKVVTLWKEETYHINDKYGVESHLVFAFFETIQQLMTILKEESAISEKQLENLMKIQASYLQNLIVQISKA